MQSQEQHQIVIDRRKEAPEHSIWWDKLSLAQKFSASSLGRFGYELMFVRYESANNLAVLNCNGGLATISIDGEVDTAPNIKVR